MATIWQSWGRRPRRRHACVFLPVLRTDRSEFMNNRTAWLMWGLLLPTYFIAFFHRTSLSPIGNELAVAFGMTTGVGAALGTLAGIYFFIYGLLQIPSGIVADTVGARRTVSLGSALMGVATLVFAIAPSLSVAMIARFFIGFGAAFNFIALLRMQVNWFDKSNFALLTGLTVVAGNLGALFGIGPFALVAQKFGWRPVMIAIGLATLAFAAMIAVFVRNQPESRPAAREEHPWEMLKRVVGRRNNHLTFVAFGLASGVYITFTGFWGVPFLMHTAGMSALSASGCTTALTLGVVIGSPLTALAVRLFHSPRRAGVTLLGVAGALWTAVYFAPLASLPHPAVIVLFFALGLFLSGQIIPYSTVRTSNDEHEMGTALAYTNTAGFATIAALQPLVGVILDHLAPSATSGGMPVYPPGAYHVAFGILLALHMTAVVAYAMVREP